MSVDLDQVTIYKFGLMALPRGDRLATAIHSWDPRFALRDGEHWKIDVHDEIIKDAKVWLMGLSSICETRDEEVEHFSIRQKNLYQDLRKLDLSSRLTEALSIYPEALGQSANYYADTERVEVIQLVLTELVAELNAIHPEPKRTPEVDAAVHSRNEYSGLYL